jgi:hypothetical protein
MLPGRGLCRRLAIAFSVGGVALAAPAGADASTLILRPDVDQLAGWTAVPVGARWDALNDPVLAPAAPSTASDYLTSTSSGTQIVQTTLSDAALPAGEPVTGGTAWAYLQTGTSRTIIFGASDATHTIGSMTVPAGSPAGWYSVPLPEVMTQKQVNDLIFTASHTGGSGTANFLYAFYVQVDTTSPAPPPVDPPPSDPPPSDPPPSDPPPADPPPVDPAPADPPADTPPVDPGTLPVDPGTVVTTPTDPGAVVPDPTGDLGDTTGVHPELGPGKSPLAIFGKNPVATPKGDVPVEVACPVSEAAGCTGVMWLEEPLDTHSKGKRLSAARRSPKRFSKRKRYRVAAGQKKSVPVRLDRRSFRNFRNKRSFKVTVVAEQKDSAGRVVTQRRTVRVFNTKKKKKR